jgi:putative ABC transport system permease protein
MSRLVSGMVGAFSSLRGSALRSALTMLGVAVGVGLDVLLVAIGHGVEQDIGGELQRIGANLVVILPGKLDASGMPNPLAFAALTTLTEGDAASLARVRGIQECVPLVLLSASAERGRESRAVLVVACTSRVATLRPVRIAEGRFFREAEERERVCVLADEPRRELFGAGRALGEFISVRGIRYRVVGVLGPDPPSLFATLSFANVVYTPLAAAQRTLGSVQVSRIFLKIDRGTPPGPILSSIRATLRARHHGREDFGVLTQEQLLRAIFRVFTILTALLAGISAVSLVVAGMGVMNIMLVTVTERTHEIGLRRAVGARRGDIFTQFLAEALVICLAGGLAGVGAAAGVCVAAAARSPLKPVVTPSGLAMALAVCLSVGIVFGVAPAMRAARLDPVDALRRE